MGRPAGANPGPVLALPHPARRKRASGLRSAVRAGLSHYDAVVGLCQQHSGRARPRGALQPAAAPAPAVPAPDLHRGTSLESTGHGRADGRTRVQSGTLVPVPIHGRFARQFPHLGPAPGTGADGAGGAYADSLRTTDGKLSGERRGLTGPAHGTRLGGLHEIDDARLGGTECSRPSDPGCSTL